MSNKKKENIFEIMDGMMFQLSRTKKMFMIMILTVLIIPPVALVVITSVAEPPFQAQFEQRLQDRLDTGEITQEEYDNIKEKVGQVRPHELLHPPQLVILIISLAWLGVGIRQWIILSKWDKRYKKFKAQQDEVDKQFHDESDETQ